MPTPKESGFRTTTLVTQYPRSASPFNVHDMIGNAWEWCANGFAKGETSDLTVDIHRVVRGGSFLSPKERCTTRFRYALDPLVRYHSIGFRIVCDYDMADVERFE